MRYGQAITWGTLSAPHLFSGVCTSYSYRDQTTRQLDPNEAGDYDASIHHSRKADVRFEAKIRKASTDFLDLSTKAAALTVTGITGGVLLVRRAVQRWRLLQVSTASIEGTHYPDMSIGAGSALTGDLDAYGSAQGLSIVKPDDVLQYSTTAFTHAAGVVHSVELTQELSITEDEPSPDGKILGAEAHGYLCTLSLEILAKAAKPAVGSILAFTASPDSDRTSGFKIENVEDTFSEERGKMYRIDSLWIPAYAA